MVFAGLLLPVSVLFVAITLTSAQGYYNEITQKNSASLATHLVKESGIMEGDTLNSERLAQLTKTLAMTNPGVEIYLLDDLGDIISASESLSILRVDLKPLRKFLTGKPSYPILGTDPRRNKKAIFSTAALPGGEGYLYVVLNNDLQNSIMRSVQASTVLRLSLWGSLVTVILLLLGAMLGFTLLTKRLRRLRTAMNAFRRNDFRVSTLSLASRPAGGDEIDDVQAVFRDMTSRISEQIEALERADRQRRDLITNISHDLRTPLAALQGYLEMLSLRRDRLSREEQESFLKAAWKHGERLDKLIAQLFELSTLDAEAELPRLETFPVNELVQDIAMKYQIHAREKGVVLRVRGVRDLPFVRADIGLIERAIANLVENAIRHTPAGGCITLALRQRGARVEVEVQDTGEGIPEAVLPHIFERFFQGYSRARSGTGAGLGLAITKRILELHGQSIRVESRPGEGARFWFGLPIP